MEMGLGTERQKMQGRAMYEIRAGHGLCSLDWRLALFPETNMNTRIPMTVPLADEQSP